jgi:CRISPR/Cas system CSM-associated protein Csm3 (group 7 of RAMP superfamily)
MEKAELIIELTKKKKLAAKLRFLESGKTMTLGSFKPKDDSHNGKTVDVERKKGQVVKILLDSQVLFSTGKSGTQQENKPGKDIAHLKDVSYPASAPYNFVPLNKKVVEVSPESLRATRKHKGEEKSKSNRDHEDDKLTGWIKLDIETKTPLYIRDTLNSEEIKKQQIAESNDKKYINSDFYSPNGRIQIPGSSLKGMIRNIMEITTYGKFESYDDKTLYYRGLADKSNLRSEYQEKMSSYDSRAKKSIYTVSAGVLTREGFNYFITPSNYEPIKLSNSEKDKYEPINFYKRDNGFLIVSGKMQNKKNDWIIRYPDKESKKIPITEIDVESYKGDTNRGSYIETNREDQKKEHKVPNLIECLHKNKAKEVPCFYVQWQDSLGKERVSFGHTPMFRLAYEKTIGDHVPVPGYRIDDITIERLKEEKRLSDSLEKIKTLERKEYTQKKLEDKLRELGIGEGKIESILKHTAIIDFVEAIFGNEKSFSGRVFFEDAFLNEGQEPVEMGKSIPEILSSPKPTTFQHYLTQTSDNSKELNHYNTEAPIRGYKLYWHKSGNNWQESNPLTDVDLDRGLVGEKSQHTIVNPVKPGTRFAGKIRFENLSERELGSILFALSLPEGCCHKLGMGKPLGLGSVIIKPTLFLSNRKERYKNLFAEWGDNNPEPVDFKIYISKFEEYILKQIKEPNIHSLWDTERLKELKIMLDFEIGKELESKGKTSYMNISPQNEFKNRSILPLPSDLELSLSNTEETKE